MIKIRLKSLALNSSGSFDNAPNPNRDGEGAIRTNSDMIFLFVLSNYSFLSRREIRERQVEKNDLITI